jgi:hypothetical protein
MDLMKYIEQARTYYQREGHYPPSWEDRRRERRALEEEEAAAREARETFPSPTFLPNRRTSRRWPWK